MIEGLFDLYDLKHPTATFCIECPAGWTSFGEYCYKPTTNNVSKTYYVNAAECREMGARVAAPHSAEENEFLVKIANGTDVWISCSDEVKEGAYSFLAVISETLLH